MAHHPNNAALREDMDRLAHGALSGQEEVERDEIVEQLGRALSLDSKSESGRRWRRATHHRAQRFITEEDL
jgi:hypothetical protein